MGAQKLLLRWYIQATRRMPPWLKTRRARIAAFAAFGALALGFLADIGDTFDFLFPEPPPATSADIDALRAVLVAEMRAQGIIVDARAQSEFETAMVWFEGANDARVPRAVALFGQGEPERALSLLTGVAEDKAKGAKKELAAKAFESLGAVAATIDRPAALAAFQNALALAPNDPYLNFRAGSLQHDLGALDAAEAANARAIELATPGDDETRWIAPVARMNNALIAKLRGDIDGARAGLEQAVKAFERADSQYDLAIAYVNLGSLAMAPEGNLAGPPADPATAERYFRNALDIAHRLRDLEVIASSNLGLARIRQSYGDTLGAMELSGRAIGLAELAGAPDLIAQARVQIGFLLLANHQYQDAIGAFETGERVYSDLRNPTGLALAKMGIGIAYGAAGDPATGCRELEDGAAMMRGLGAANAAALIEEVTRSACGAGAVAPDEWLEQTPIESGANDAWSPYDELGRDLPPPTTEPQ